MCTDTVGNGTHQEQCSAPPTSPRFDLQQLQTPSTIFSTWWNKLQKTLQTYTSILCLMVLLIEGTRTILFFAMFIQTALLHGKDAARAIAFLVCCDSMKQARRVARKSRRPELHPKETDFQILPTENPDSRAGPVAKETLDNPQILVQ